ncbi:TAXI family TRAP transporter solute-binding subunit [Phaeobacter gallaeciensis]|uniref:TRAP-type uncharacterized transport system, periplasmic component n=1 Tax=Phaeobacter gallaeciensis TaxID=60890 RepID=A0AAC9ZDA6_9RHOB|nr:TAXI family TRAP transporter solute-binding subunit [Phaeobacter gallaeciensis]AHD11872.1 TRAP-type uncharacterized transport system, periplasmic component [Phaeobacter gallaeciensis DSM 26640]ATE95135.1 TRAP-type uncharacterized transport system, periplasmic component [Phaeobacter gallaeciensis]ATE99443.1 TRAP-type uncharacterized transport system, periplasmic component [Phaeobacter gallaeciensis]ATF03840.1 TRAP-type uncharacterized transport system, periplasmic component [Phaeobacter galla
MTKNMHPGPRIDRTYRLDFIGDWGQANFHRIMSWLTQEFCDRAGPRSRTRISSVLGGGLEALTEVHEGAADLCLVTPHLLMAQALTGEGIFAELGAMPNLRALAVLPQVDRMMLAVAPEFGIESFEDLRTKKPALRFVTSTDAEGNFIGYVATRFLAAHGISRDMITEWGGEMITAHRPDECLELVRLGKADAVLQEAIMTPWWRNLVESGQMRPVPAEETPLEALTGELGMPAATIPAGYWSGYDTPVPALDFSDFIIVVRDDMPEEVAHLLTWCLVETRGAIEQQYAHIPPDRSPLSYPLQPEKMPRTALPLHPGAQRFYEEAGLLS